uniref:Ribosomal protein L36e n=1 Tax=Cryptocaryon irritans TaxID=153251 RepID=R9QWG9_9CILI|nr:ribosomal protein L36e [Cryptocaryon irritans]
MTKGIAIGLNKGFITTKLSDKSIRPRPVLRKGRLGKRVELIRNIIKEVVGFAPYEKRILVLLRTGLAKDAKKALKLAKRRLGTHRRGKKKREEMEEVLRAQRRKEEKKK